MSVRELDFTNTNDFQSLPPGDYRAKVQSIEVRDGREAPYWNWCFASIERETEGWSSFLMTSEAPKALFRLRQTVAALGVEIPKDKVRLDTEKLVGRVGLIHVVNEPYVGSDGVSRDSYKIGQVFPLRNDPDLECQCAEPDGSPPDAEGLEGDGFQDVDLGGDDIPF